MRILFTCMGTSDPVRGYRDGPMLHILRWYRPEKVWVFLTEEAAELYLSLGNYQDAKEQGQALYYAQGLAAQAEGRDKDAAAYFELIPGYEDADSRVEAIYDAAYASAPTPSAAGWWRKALPACPTYSCMRRAPI